jgi:hypothetical protein
LLFVCDGVSLRSPDWPGTHHPPASASQVLGLQGCSTTTDLQLFSWPPSPQEIGSCLVWVKSQLFGLVSEVPDVWLVLQPESDPTLTTLHIPPISISTFSLSCPMKEPRTQGRVYTNTPRTCTSSVRCVTCSTHKCDLGLGSALMPGAQTNDGWVFCCCSCCCCCSVYMYEREREREKERERMEGRKCMMSKIGYLRMGDWEE